MLRGLRGTGGVRGPQVEGRDGPHPVSPIGAGMGEMVALGTGVVKSLAHLHSTL